MNFCALMFLGIGVLCTPPETANPTVIDTLCEATQPIRWSRSDTDETIIQVKAHNAVWKSLCAKDEGEINR